MFDPEGTIVEEWIVVNPIVQSVNFGDLDYGSDDLVEYELNIVYDWAEHSFGDGTKRFEPDATQYQNFTSNKYKNEEQFSEYKKVQFGHLMQAPTVFDDISGEIDAFGEQLKMMQQFTADAALASAETGGGLFPRAYNSEFRSLAEINNHASAVKASLKDCQEFQNAQNGNPNSTTQPRDKGSLDEGSCVD